MKEVVLMKGKKIKDWVLKYGNLYISKDAKRIIDGQFSSSRLMEVIIPGNVKTIGNFAFIGNDMFELSISDGVENIGNNAFSYNCLSDITIPNSVRVIGDYAFYKNKLKKVEIPSSVKSIGTHAFDEIDITYGNTLITKELIHKYGTENIIKLTNLINLVDINSLNKLPYEVVSNIPLNLSDINMYFNNEDSYYNIKDYVFKNNRKISDDNLYKICYVLGLFNEAKENDIINVIESFSDNEINIAMDNVYITKYKKEAKELIMNLFNQGKIKYKNNLIIAIIYNCYESIRSDYNSNVKNEIYNYIDNNKLLVDDTRKDSTYNVNLSKKRKKGNILF